MSESNLKVWAYFQKLTCLTPRWSAPRSAAEIDKIGRACSGSAEPDRPARDCPSHRPRPCPRPHPQPQKVRQARDCLSPHPPSRLHPLTRPLPSSDKWTR